MFSLNRTHLIGYQTQQLAVRQTPSGTSVVDLNLVVPYRFKSESGQMLEGKSFHTVTLWGSLAEFAGKYLRAGSQVFAGGRLQTDSWEDEKSGEKRSRTKVIAQELILLDPREGQLPEPASTALLSGGLNRADIIGHMTRDPELRTTTSGQSVLTLGVATNERWKDRATQENKERTEFHSVVVWGQLAKEVSATVKKGMRVYVSGRVQNRSWETQSGSKRTTTEIVADSVALLGVKNSTAQAAFSPEAGLRQSKATAPADNSPFDDAPPADTGVPEVQYEPSIKAEDLPF